MNQPYLRESDYPVQAWFTVATGGTPPGNLLVRKMTVVYDRCSITRVYAPHEIPGSVETAESTPNEFDFYAGKHPEMKSVYTVQGGKQGPLVVVEWILRSPGAFYDATNKRLFLVGVPSQPVRPSFNTDGNDKVHVNAESLCGTHGAKR